MGQGTESCGGYELEFDPYDDFESGGFTVWNGRDGDYLVSKMSVGHMRSAIRLCSNLMRTASYSCEEDKWQEWINVFEDEIRFRKLGKNGNTNTCKKAPSGTQKTENKPTRGAKKEVTCRCGVKFLARVADIKRGWGKSCSKSCAAKSRK